MFQVFRASFKAPLQRKSHTKDFLARVARVAVGRTRDPLNDWLARSVTSSFTFLPFDYRLTLQ
jgi:hypothetical protein